MGAKHPAQTSASCRVANESDIDSEAKESTDQQAERRVPVFGKLPDGTARMLRTDLEAARKKWIDDAKTGTERDQRERSDFLWYETGWTRSMVTVGHWGDGSGGRWWMSRRTTEHHTRLSLQTSGASAPRKRVP
jgi:hypothetical protein